MHFFSILLALFFFQSPLWASSGEFEKDEDLPPHYCSFEYCVETLPQRVEKKQPSDIKLVFVAPLQNIHLLELYFEGRDEKAILTSYWVDDKKYKECARIKVNPLKKKLLVKYPFYKDVLAETDYVKEQVESICHRNKTFYSNLDRLISLLKAPSQEIYLLNDAMKQAIEIDLRLRTALDMWRVQLTNVQK